MMHKSVQWQGMPSKIPGTAGPHLNKNDPDDRQLGIAVLRVLQACTCTVHDVLLTLKASGPQGPGTSAVQMGRGARLRTTATVISLDTQTTATTIQTAAQHSKQVRLTTLSDAALENLAKGVGNKGSPRCPPFKELGTSQHPAASPLHRYGGKPRSQAKDTRMPRDRHPTELPPRYSNFSPSHMVAKAAGMS